MKRAPFRDRLDAGRRLAERLGRYGGRDDVLLLALPRGGVPVGYEVAKALGAPLDVLVVRKLGLPGQEELALGAVAGGGLLVLDDRLVRAFGIRPEHVEQIVSDELDELQRRESAYRGNRAAPRLEGKTVVLIDDGLATGATMRAAALSVRQGRPARVVVGVPVAAGETCAELGDVADEIVCCLKPRPFRAVSAWFEDFSQTSDAEVRDYLERARARASSAQ
jgi:putative phosphoribosyl transferase